MSTTLWRFLFVTVSLFAIVIGSALKRESDSCDHEKRFKCHAGPCIPRSFYCDGEVDCFDASDEIKEDCEAYKKTCPHDQFLCVSDECINKTSVCDGTVDCLDGWSDESDCIKPHECHKDDGKFLCKSGNICISGAEVCNGKDDCPDKSDEFSGCEKLCPQAQCSQGCIPYLDNNVTATACHCWEGYYRSNRDKGKCVDIDECQDFGTCSQQCKNLIGSFKCSCIGGFREVGNSSCEVMDKSAALIYASDMGLKVQKMMPNLNKSSSYTIIEKKGSPVCVTFDARRNWIYWTDVEEHNEAIWRSRLDGTGVEKIIDDGLKIPEGIAFDWIGNNIYFADSTRAHIVACTANGSSCTVIIQEMLDKPRDIALDPNSGLMYWTDWGLEPALWRAGMDGSTPIAIVRQNLKWPNGIAIDHGNGRLYWTDAGMDRIESVNLNGGDRRVVHSAGVKHPFGVGILGDDIYWSDWNLFEIQKSNKFNGSNRTTLVRQKFERFNGLTIFHKANQPITRHNHCEEAGCSHICLLTPKDSYRCMCPIGMKLLKGKKNCTNIEKKIAPPTKPTSREDVGGSKGKESKDKDKDYDDFDDETSTTETPWNRPIQLRSKGVQVQTIHQIETKEKRREVVSHGGHPLAIALGIVILLLLVAVVIGILLQRRNIHPKVLVRPYVQHWVRYVNTPVQKFFEGRGEQLDGKKNVFGEIYPNPVGDNSYSRVYENIDPVSDIQDNSGHRYDEPSDGHRIIYSQKERLLD